MKTAALSILAIALSITGCFASPQAPTALSQQASGNKEPKEKVYDGNWWLTKEVDERYGFMDGVDDCLTWVAHAKGPPGGPYQFEQKITRYYKAHPAERSVSVLEVWRKVARESPPPKPIPGGETWSNPHGYFDGTYWVQMYYDSARQAFIEGYLWCLRTCVDKPSEMYARPAAYYVHRISDYIQTHPKTAYDEAIATILSRFRDNPKQKATVPDPPAQW